MHIKIIKSSIKQVEINNIINTDKIVDRVQRKPKVCKCMAMIANSAKHYKQATYTLYIDLISG